MNLAKARAFNGFILDAKNAFDCVFNRDVTEDELEQIKATYSGTEFEKYKKEFDAELLANYKEYKDESLLLDYLQASITEVRNVKFSVAINSIIIKNEWEIGFLLNLKKDIESQINLIELFYDFNHNFEHEELMYYCQRLESSEKSINEVDKLISIANLPPAMDNRFDFESLLKECDSLENNTKRIKLITKRLYEFEQWKLLNEKVNEEFTFIVTNYNELFYPNFEKLCGIEIEKLQKMDALDTALQNDKSPEKPVSVETDKLINSDYVWKSSATDLLELVASLYQNKSIVRKDGKTLTRKELTEYFQLVFNTKIDDIEGKLYKASGRNNNTPFLENLSQQFRNYVADKEAKMVKRR